MPHNHMTRDIKPKGKCDGCDDYWRRKQEEETDDVGDVQEVRETP